MRLFQNSGVMPAYRPRLRRLVAGASGFAAQLDVALNDRFNAMHILQPVLTRDADAFFTNGNDEDLQRTWAWEKGMKADASLADILLAQIEEHRTEVFYNTHPALYGSAFVQRLPSCVKRTVAWLASPSGSVDFSAYDVMVCNFNSILDSFRKAGVRAEWFAPAHDPELDAYGARSSRPVDLAFIGTYSRHHSRRAALIEAVADLGTKFNVALHLDSSSRFLKLAESPLGFWGPLKKHRRPPSVRNAAREPVFGRDLYATLSSAKIVVNGAIDMAGNDRGNMRCWEAMGAGALMLGDAGNYPPGMVSGKTIMTYDSLEDAIRLIRSLLADEPARLKLAAAGRSLVQAEYSKSRQWQRFQELAVW